MPEPRTVQRFPDSDYGLGLRTTDTDIRHADATQQQGLVTRLNRIEGQVRGIRRMVQESRRCLEILQQLAAAEAALNRVSLAVLKVHVESCVPAAAAEGPEPQAKALAELVDIFDFACRPGAEPATRVAERFARLVRSGTRVPPAIPGRLQGA